MTTQEAMDVIFPYRNWRDDPDKVRGEAQRTLEMAVMMPATPTPDT